VGRILRLTLKSCGILVVLVLLAGCGQVNSPAERQEKKAGVEQAVQEPKEKKRAEDAHMSQAEIDAAKAAAADVEVTHSAGASARSKAQRAGSFARGPATQKERTRIEELNCRLERYAYEQGMSQKEKRAFSRELADYVMHSEHEETDAWDAADALGVPRYGNYCKVGGE
jgi:hypothetical protein